LVKCLISFGQVAGPGCGTEGSEESVSGNERGLAMCPGDEGLKMGNTEMPEGGKKLVVGKAGGQGQGGVGWVIGCLSGCKNGSRIGCHIGCGSRCVNVSRSGWHRDDSGVGRRIGARWVRKEEGR
jgi:hypothetical protein